MLLMTLSLTFRMRYVCSLRLDLDHNHNRRQTQVIRIRTAILIVYQIHLSPSYHRAKILLLQMLIAFNNMHLMRQLNMEMEEELRMKLWTCSYEVTLSFGNELD